MARIITQLYEHTTRAALESALATRELGYTDESGNESLSFKTNAGAYRRFPSLTLLARSTAAALIGYDPTASGLAATTLQAAIDELKSTGTGGTLTGTGTVNSIPVWTSTTAQGNSILSQVSSKVRVGGDTLANIYLYAAGVLGTDGDVRTGGQVTVGTNLLVAGSVSLATGGSSVSFGGGWSSQDAIIADKTFDSSTANGQWAALFEQTLTKNNSNTRTFYGLRAVGIFNLGGSNANTTYDLISGDTVNSALTGMTVNLLRLSFGGVEMMKLASVGDLYVTRDITASRDIIALGYLYGQGLSVYPGPVVTAPTNGFKHNVVSAWIQRNTSGAVRHSVFTAYAVLDTGASNASETLDVLAVDTLNIGTTGLTVNLMGLKYGGVEKARVDSNGDLYNRRLYSSEFALENTLLYQNGNFAKNSSIWHDGVSSRTGIGASFTNALLYLASAINGSADLEFDGSGVTPTVAGTGNAKVYVKANKLIFQFDDSSTTRYKYLDLTGTGVTWVHSTSAP